MTKKSKWIRFEAEIKGRYAHELTTHLKECQSDTDLKNLLLSAILDKYMFFYKRSNKPHKITELMIELLEEKNFSFSSAKQKISSLEESIHHIEHSSGLFSLLYKVDEIWGKETSIELLEYLYHQYKQCFRPNADHKKWLAQYSRYYRENGKPFELKEKKVINVSDQTNNDNPTSQQK
ncbi:hypothetical protein AB1I63_09725 [Streptococcus pneumoniae]